MISYCFFANPFKKNIYPVRPLNPNIAAFRLWSAVLAAAFFVEYAFCSFCCGQGAALTVSNKDNIISFRTENASYWKSPFFTAADTNSGVFNISLKLKGFRKMDIALTKSASGWDWNGHGFERLAAIKIDPVFGRIKKISQKAVPPALLFVKESAPKDRRFIYIEINSREDKEEKLIAQLSACDDCH